MVTAAAAVSVVVAVDVSVTTVRLQVGSAAALVVLVVVMQEKSRLLAIAVRLIAVVLLATAMTGVAPSRAVLHHRATITPTAPVSMTAARAVMTVAPATAVDLRNVTTGVAIAALAVVRKVFQLHPAVTLQTASRPLPGLRARCLCRAMRKSAQHVLHVEAFRKL